LAQLQTAIIQAARLIVSAIEATSPETDCRLLPRKLQELVNSSISAQNSALVTITASDVAPKLNVAADTLACAHSMYSKGDKTNALRLVIHAFESPDCFPLMISLSELNEEVDPSDLNTVISRINKGEAHDRDIMDHDPDEILYGDDIPPEHVDPESAHEDALVGNPAANVNAIQDQDLTWSDSGAPYADYSNYDFMNQGVPPDSVQVLRDVLSEAYDEDSDSWEKVIASDCCKWEKHQAPGGMPYLKAVHESHKAFIHPSHKPDKPGFYAKVLMNDKKVHDDFHPTIEAAKQDIEAVIKGKKTVEANGLGMGAGGFLMDHEQNLGLTNYGGDANTTDSGYNDNWKFDEDDGADVTSAVPTQQVADITPGYGDNHRTNVSTDPATDAYWNPANWNLDADLPYRSDPTIMDFDDMAAVNPGMTDLNGIDNTAKGEPRNESDTGFLQQTFGLSPTLNPSQEIIARIKDSRVLAAINILSMKKDEQSRAKLTAFINVYCTKNNII